jgi:hypothetical protein
VFVSFRLGAAYLVSLDYLLRRVYILIFGLLAYVQQLMLLVRLVVIFDLKLLLLNASLIF